MRQGGPPVGLRSGKKTKQQGTEQLSQDKKANDVMATATLPSGNGRGAHAQSAARS